jgi:hypothetical protein
LRFVAPSRFSLALPTPNVGGMKRRDNQGPNLRGY